MLALALFVPAFAAEPSDRVDADPFRASSSLPLGFGTVQGESPVLGSDGYSFGFSTAVAEDLAVFRYDRGGETPILGQVVRSELAGGWQVNTKVRLDVAIPFYPYAEAPWTEFQGPAMGDMRIQGTLPVVSQEKGPIAVAVVPRLGLPTGSRNAYLRRGLSAGVLGAFGDDYGEYGWIGNLGFTASGTDEIEGLTTGSTIDLLGGGWYVVEPGFRVGAELSGALGLANGRTGAGSSHGEGHLFAQIRLPTGLGLTGGVGAGMGGVGAPDWRAFGAITYGLAVRDSDRDGLLDDADACPIDAEDTDGWEDVDGCPETDNDNDGLVDGSDACPNEAEDPDGFEDDGCPETDNDADGVTDAEDLCPDTSGSKDFGGCPDTDGDGMQDSEDACPEEAGTKATMGCADKDNDLVADYRDECPDAKRPNDEDASYSNGCPKKAWVSGKTVRYVGTIAFDDKKFALKPETTAVLDEIAKALLASPWVSQLEVGSHTDDAAGADAAMTLTTKRAQAVVDYLVKKGVAKERLVAKGYGGTVPVDTNRTAMGRSNNRRVELVVLGTDDAMRPALREPGRPAGTPAPEGTSAPTEASSETGAVTPVDAPPAPVAAGQPAKLTVKLSGLAFADVYVDDVKLPRAAPFTELDIKSGKHLVVIVNNRSGFTHEETIEVAPGQTYELSVGKALPPTTPAPANDSPWGPLPQ